VPAISEFDWTGPNPPCLPQNAPTGGQ
jgi:hypothetical protein